MDPPVPARTKKYSDLELADQENVPPVGDAGLDGQMSARGGESGCLRNAHVVDVGRTNQVTQAADQVSARQAYISVVEASKAKPRQVGDTLEGSVLETVKLVPGKTSAPGVPELNQALIGQMRDHSHAAVQPPARVPLGNANVNSQSQNA